MEDFQQKIFKKRIEEIKLEKTYLEDLKKDFELETEIYQKNKSLFKSKILENNLKLKENKIPDIKITNDSIQKIKNEIENINNSSNIYQNDCNIEKDNLEKEFRILEENKEVLNTEKEKYNILSEGKEKN